MSLRAARSARSVAALLALTLLILPSTSVLGATPGAGSMPSSAASGGEHVYDSAAASTTTLHNWHTDAGSGERASTDRSRSSTSLSAPRYAPKAGRGADEAFHYTSREAIQSIEKNGLRRGSYAAPRGDLSPLQAQIDLALPPNRGLRDSVVRVDLAGFRKSGYEVPDFSQVGRKFNMPGGGQEVQFPYSVPPDFLKVVPR